MVLDGPTYSSYLGLFSLIHSDLRDRNIASLGALIVIMSLSFDPFLQLLVTYQGALEDYAIAGATIARAKTFKEGFEAPISTAS